MSSRRPRDLRLAAILLLLTATAVLLVTFAISAEAALWTTAAVAVFATAITVVGRRLEKRFEPLSASILQEESRKLAGRVRDDETRAQQRALLGRNDPLPLRFRGSTGEFGLDRLHEAFIESPDHRLIITGGAGAGKTFAISGLILTILGTRGTSDPVPVRIPAATQAPLASLGDWVAAALVTQFAMNRVLAEALVQEGFVLPVIDGLDELGAADQGEAGLRGTRAAVLCAALNSSRQFGRRSPFILTSRSEFLDRLPAEHRPLRAASVSVQPVSWSEAAEYLATWGDVSVWQDYIDRATSPAGDTATNAIDTPLRVSLALVRCRNRDDVEHLFDAARDDTVDEFLIPGFLRIAGLDLGITGNEVEPAARRARADLNALRVLARYLEANRVAARIVGGEALSATDLVPHKLWPLAGVGRVLLVDTTLAAILSLPGLWIVALCAARLPAFAAFPGFLMFVGVYGYMLLRTSRKAWLPPAQVSFEVARSGLSPAKLLPALLLSAAIAALLGRLLGVIVGALAFFCATAAIGLTVGMGQTLVTFSQTSAGSPWELLERDRRVSRLSAFVVTPALAAVVLALGFPLWTLAIVLGYALLVGDTVASAPWRRYVAFRLAGPRLLPFRSKLFMERMYDCYMLRIAGGAYQFSHLELQRWLASNGQPAAD